MAGDVFYRDVGSVATPRGSIVPEGARAEEVDGTQILRIPAGVTSIPTPVIFPGFTVVIEGEVLDFVDDAIVDAALYADHVQAQNATIRTTKQIEVTGTFQAKSVHAMTVRGDRIEAVDIESAMSVRADTIAIIRHLTVGYGSVRTPRFINASLDGANDAIESVAWEAALAGGEVPDWLQAAGE